MPQSLVNAIYDRYSEISSNELDASVTTAPILTNNLCADLCSVNCIDYLSSSSSSCSSFPSPNSSTNESSQPQIYSPATTSGISFYIPPAYSPRKTRKLFCLICHAWIQVRNREAVFELRPNSDVCICVHSFLYLRLLFCCRSNCL